MVISPYRYVSEEDLAKCILELEQQLSVRIYQAARRQWPGKTLSPREILRRYTLCGTESFKNLSPTDQAGLAHQFQASMTASGDKRLKSWPTTIAANSKLSFLISARQKF